MIRGRGSSYYRGRIRRRVPGRRISRGRGGTIPPMEIEDDDYEDEDKFDEEVEKPFMGRKKKRTQKKLKQKEKLDKKMEKKIRKISGSKK